jgi:signal transduction histidine kinase/CheY-like chemotaxis protein
VKRPLEPESVEAVELLLVDDREENLLALEAVLEDSGYTLIKVSSGDAALRYLLDHVPALILLDVQMPGLDGFATASIIKASERTREIPIIFLTALNEDDKVAQRGYEHGAVDYLYKPFNPHVLRSKVAVFADLHRKNDRLIRAERKLRENERRERERHFAELEIRTLRREQTEQRRYRELVDGINQGVVWAASWPSVRFSFVSARAETLLGFPEEAWLGNPDFWQEHIHPDDRELFLRNLRRLKQDHENFIIEHRFINASNEVMWLQTSLRLTTTEEGRDPELRGLSVDITKLKEAEHMLERAKMRSDLLAEVSLVLNESLDDGVALPKVADAIAGRLATVVCIQGRDSVGSLRTLAASHRDPVLNQVTQNYVARWGASLREPPAAFYSEVSREELAKISFAPEQIPFFDHLHLNSAITYPLIARGERIGTLLLARSGTRKLTALDYSLTEDLAYRIGTAIDNSNLYREAQKAVRMRDEFLSIASHELKTPLTPLKIQTQQLLRLISKDSLATVDPARVAKMLEISNRQIERLNKLIEDLLDISRISVGKMGLRIDSFDLMDLLHDLSTRFSGHLAAAGCAIRVHGPSDPVRVKWDNFRIEQVLVNLLTNATKYAPGKPVDFSVETSGEGVTISVTDQGIGIAPSDQSRIFQRFERAVSGTHFGGLGLGLYISTQIAEAHGGRIWVDSEVGRGSTFHLLLPWESPGEPAETALAPRIPVIDFTLPAPSLVPGLMN